MNQSDKESSAKLLAHVTHLLNEIILDEGYIDKDNPKIWKGFLHQPAIDNYAWKIMLEGVLEIDNIDGSILRVDHTQTFEEALAFIRKHEHLNDRIMDTRNAKVNGKKHAWKCLMSIREVVNRARNVNIPNVEVYSGKQL